MKTTPSALAALARQTRNHRLSLWLRLTLWAMAHADDTGRARAYPGELREVLDTNAHEVSRAIRLAKDRQLLHESSHAGCLVLIGYTPTYTPRSTAPSPQVSPDVQDRR